MTTTTRLLRRSEAAELIELLEIVAQLCVGAYSTISAELAWWAEAYDAGDLRAAALRLAERVAAVHGLTSRERTP